MTKEIKTLFENKTPMVVRLSFWQGTTVNIGGKTVEIYGSNSLKDILLGIITYCVSDIWPSKAVCGTSISASICLKWCTYELALS